MPDRSKVLQFKANFNVTVLSLLLILPPTSSYGQATPSSAQEGQQLGRLLLDSFRFPRFKGSDLDEANGSVLMDLPEGEITLFVDELFPELKQSQDIPLGELFDDEARLLESAEEQRGLLQEDASFFSEAYQSVDMIKKRDRDPLKGDPIFNLTEFILEDPNRLAQTYEQCEIPQHSPQWVTCDKYPINFEECEIKHEYQAQLIDHIFGPLNLSSCDGNCLYLWIGQVGDNYWQGHCSIFEEMIGIRVNNPDAVLSATLEYAKWDDYMQIWINQEKVWSGPNDLFPPETAGACELKTNWEWQLDTDLTDWFKTSALNDTLMFKMRVSVTGLGEGYARIKINYDPDKLLVKDQWYPQNCIDHARFLKNNFSNYTLTCQQEPYVDNGCIVLQGLRICQNAFKTPPVDSISPFCTRVKVSSALEDYQGSASPLCQRLEKDPKCAFYSSECIEKDEEENCVKFQNVYDCATQWGDPKCVVSDLFPSEFDACEIVETVESEKKETVISDLHLCETIRDPQTQTLTLNTCEALEELPHCIWQYETCLDETEEGLRSELSTGTYTQSTCLESQQVYDCKTVVPINTLVKKRHYTCEGPVKCLGNECVEPLSYAEADFTQALAQLNLAQDMGNDLSCSGQEGLADVHCEIFKGESQGCLKSIGNVVNCCDKPSHISLSDYLMLLKGIQRVNTTLGAFEPSEAFYGAWEALQSPFKEGWQSIISSISSRWDALVGTTPNQVGIKTAVEVTTGFMQSLTNSTAHWVGQVFGAKAQSSLFTNIGGTVTSDGILIGGDFALNALAGTLLSGIMTVYTLYTVSMLLIKIIWSCEQNDFELGVKRNLKSCHFVGAYCEQRFLGKCLEKKETYCCFASPLARIFQEQARGQLNKDFGNAKQPNCEGLKISELDHLDMNTIDLSEWIALLAQEGQLDELSDVYIEKLTGKDLLTGQESHSVVDRIFQRLDKPK